MEGQELDRQRAVIQLNHVCWASVLLDTNSMGTFLSLIILVLWLIFDPSASHSDPKAFVIDNEWYSLLKFKRETDGSKISHKTVSQRA